MRVFSNSNHFIVISDDVNTGRQQGSHLRQIVIVLGSTTPPDDHDVALEVGEHYCLSESITM